MENELRRLKGLEHFKIPVLTPHAHTIESNIQLQAYCQAVDDEVKTIFKETYKSEKTRLMEEQRRQQPLLPATAMQESTHNNQTAFTQANIQTRPPTTASNMLQHTHHQGVTPPRSPAQPSTWCNSTTHQQGSNQQAISADIVPPYSKEPTAQKYQ